MKRHLATRRLGYLGGLMIATAATLALYQATLPTHPHLQYLSGWILLGLMLVLTCYNARKKLPFLPLLNSRTWLQVHIYVGLFTGILFLLHINWRTPTGHFEWLLTLLFLAVTFSGIFGWWLSRTIPKRLTTAGGEVPYERIPVIRRDLRNQAEALVLGVIPNAKNTTLADFYNARLAEFFAAPANLLAHALGSRRALTKLLDDVIEVDRFLGPAEKEVSAKLSDLIRQKDALDFHRAGQIILKSWLFTHIPLTYGLLVFSFVHIVLVYSFSGGNR